MNDSLTFRIVVAVTALLHSCHQGTALHSFRNFVTSQIEQRGRDVKQARSLIFASQWTIGRKQQEHAKLGMIAGVRAGIVLLDVQCRMAYRADRAPEQPTKMDDQ